VNTAEGIAMPSDSSDIDAITVSTAHMVESQAHFQRAGQSIAT